MGEPDGRRRALPPKPRPQGPRAGNSARGARSEAILRAVEVLEDALPRGAELMIAELPAYGDDVVAGLRRLAREME